MTATTEPRSFTISTGAGDAVELSCGPVRVTGRRGLPAIVGGLDVDDAGTKCVLALPLGTWLSVTDGDCADPPPMPMPLWRDA